MRKKIGIIGIGNMGEALVKGIMLNRAIEAKNLFIYDHHHNILDELSTRFGVKLAKSIKDISSKVDIIIIAVKPKDIDEVMGVIKHSFSDNQLLLSVAAGVTLEHIQSYFGIKARIVRIMPNIPLMIGKGVIAIVFGKDIEEEDKRCVRQIFKSTGMVLEIDETMIDAITALSGSGPAFVSHFIQGLAEGAVKIGMKRKDALMISAQTVAGAAEMILSMGKDPEELKDMVTSPAGTTIYGIHIMEQLAFKGILITAVEASYLRAKDVNILTEKK